jgi:multiple sugar transport system substrate-binding protein
MADNARPDRRPKGVTRRDFLRYTGTAGLSLGALGLAGCSSPEQTTAGPTAGPTAGIGGAPATPSGRLEIVLFGDAVSLESWNAVFDLFQETYPDIEVAAEPLASGDWATYAQTVSTRIAGGQVPDVLRLATEGQRLFASQGLLEPLDPYIERDRQELTDYFENASDRFIDWQREYSPDGQIYFLPDGFNTMGIWYNQRVFEEAGVEPPQDDWTWDEFRQKSEQILEATGNFAMNIPPAYFAGVVPWLLSGGANIINADWDAATLDTPEALEATRFMVDYISDGLSPVPGGDFDAYALTAQGDMAMFGGGRWPIGTVRGQEAVDDMAIVEWPQGATKGTPIGWSGFPILRDSENKEAAWTFLKFMSTVEAMEARVRGGGGGEVPVLESVALGDAFTENAPEGMDSLFESVEFATPIAGPDQGALVQAAIADGFEQMFTGNVSPEEGLAALQSELTGLL